MYKRIRAQQQKLEQQKESLTQPTLIQQSVLEEIYNYRLMKIRKWRAHWKHKSKSTIQS